MIPSTYINLEDFWQTYSEWQHYATETLPELAEAKEKAASSARALAITRGMGKTGTEELIKKFVSGYTEEEELIKSTWEGISKGAVGQLLTGQGIQELDVDWKDVFERSMKTTVDYARRGYDPADLMWGEPYKLGDKLPMPPGDAHRFFQYVQFTDKQSQPIKSYTEYLVDFWGTYYGKRAAYEVNAPESRDYNLVNTAASTLGLNRQTMFNLLNSKTAEEAARQLGYNTIINEVPETDFGGTVIGTRKIYADRRYQTLANAWDAVRKISSYKKNINLLDTKEIKYTTPTGDIITTPGNKPLEMEDYYRVLFGEYSESPLAKRTKEQYEASKRAMKYAASAMMGGPSGAIATVPIEYETEEEEVTGWWT